MHLLLSRSPMFNLRSYHREFFYCSIFSIVLYALDYGSNGVNRCPLILMAKELLSAKASAGKLSERLKNGCRDRCLSKTNRNKQQRRVDFEEKECL